MDLKKIALFQAFSKQNLSKNFFYLFQAGLILSSFVLQAPDSSFFKKPASLFIFNQAHGSKTCNSSDNLALLKSKKLKLEERLKNYKDGLRVLKTYKSGNETTQIHSLTSNIAAIAGNKKACEKMIAGAEKAHKAKEKRIKTNTEKTKDKFVCNKSDEEDQLETKINNIKRIVEDREGDRGYGSAKGTFTESSLSGDFDSFLSDNKLKCNKLKNSIEKCKEAKEQSGEARSTYKRQCAGFVNSGNCEEFIKACTHCPSREDASEAYDCVRVHNKSQCPELSGLELERARKLIKNYKEDQKEALEETQDLQKDLLREEQELNRDLVQMEEEFNSSVADFKRDTDNAKENLENSFREARQVISEALNQQIAEVQKTIDNTLPIYHSFENALAKADRDYSLEVQKIQRECRQEAYMRLNQYRANRRAAIESGSYRIDFSRLVSRSRVKFQQQDPNRLQYYYKSCLKLSKQVLKNAEKKYKSQLRLIEQQKQQFEDQINKMRSRLVAFTQSASSQEQSLIQEYVKSMSGVIDRFEAGYKSSLGEYNKRKQSLILTKSKEINRLRGLISQKTQEMTVSRQSLTQQRALESQMMAQGVPTEEEDNREAYPELVASLSDLDLAIKKQWRVCQCENKESEPLHDNCPSRKSFENAEQRESRGSEKREEGKR